MVASLILHDLLLPNFENSIHYYLLLVIALLTGCISEILNPIHIALCTILSLGSAKFIKQIFVSLWDHSFCVDILDLKGFSQFIKKLSPTVIFILVEVEFLTFFLFFLIELNGNEKFSFLKPLILKTQIIIFYYSKVVSVESAKLIYAYKLVYFSISLIISNLLYYLAKANHLKTDGLLFEYLFWNYFMLTVMCSSSKLEAQSNLIIDALVSKLNFSTELIKISGIQYVSALYDDYRLKSFSFSLLNQIQLMNWASLQGQSLKLKSECLENGSTVDHDYKFPIMIGLDEIPTKYSLESIRNLGLTQKYIDINVNLFFNPTLFMLTNVCNDNYLTHLKKRKSDNSIRHSHYTINSKQECLEIQLNQDNEPRTLKDILDQFIKTYTKQMNQSECDTKSSYRIKDSLNEGRFTSEYQELGYFLFVDPETKVGYGREFVTNEDKCIKHPNFFNFSASTFKFSLSKQNVVSKIRETKNEQNTGNTMHDTSLYVIYAKIDKLAKDIELDSGTKKKCFIINIELILSKTAYKTLLLNNLQQQSINEGISKLKSMNTIKKFTPQKEGKVEKHITKAVIKHRESLTSDIWKKNSFDSSYFSSEMEERQIIKEALKKSKKNVKPNCMSSNSNNTPDLTAVNKTATQGAFYSNTGLHSIIPEMGHKTSNYFSSLKKLNYKSEDDKRILENKFTFKRNNFCCLTEKVSHKLELPNNFSMLIANTNNEKSTHKPNTICDSRLALSNCKPDFLQANHKGARETLLISKYANLLISKLSHEIRTSLISIKVISDKILDKYINNYEIFSSFCKINSLSSIITFLVYDLSDYLQEQMSPVNLGNLALGELKDSIKDLSNAYLTLFNKEGSAELFFSIEEDLILQSINTDEKKIKQILLNLISNCIKNTIKGDIRIVFKKGESKCIEEHLTQEYGLIEISDEALGVPEIYFEYLNGDHEDKLIKERKHSLHTISNEQNHLSSKLSNGSNNLMSFTDNLILNSNHHYSSKNGLGNGFILCKRISRELGYQLSCEVIYDREEAKKKVGSKFILRFPLIAEPDKIVSETHDQENELERIEISPKQQSGANQLVSKNNLGFSLNLNYFESPNVEFDSSKVSIEVADQSENNEADNAEELCTDRTVSNKSFIRKLDENLIAEAKAGFIAISYPKVVFQSPIKRLQRRSTVNLYANYHNDNNPFSKLEKYNSIIPLNSPLKLKSMLVHPNLEGKSNEMATIFNFNSSLNTPNNNSNLDEKSDQGREPESFSRKKAFASNSESLVKVKELSIDKEELNLNEGINRHSKPHFKRTSNYKLNIVNDLGVANELIFEPSNGDGSSILLSKQRPYNTDQFKFFEKIPDNHRPTSKDKEDYEKIHYIDYHNSMTPLREVRLNRKFKSTNNVIQSSSLNDSFEYRHNMDYSNAYPRRKRSGVSLLSKGVALEVIKDEEIDSVKDVEEDYDYICALVDDKPEILNSEIRLLQRQLEAQLGRKVKQRWKFLKLKDGFELIYNVYCDLSNKANKIKLVLCDEMMEYMNGTETLPILDKLFQKAGASKFPILFISAFTNNSYYDKIKQGNWEIELLEKPLNLKNSKKIIDTYFSQHKVTDV